ncbi:MAG: hypothetical protein GF388_11695 [Candidatus Aegiribacteria sp.]|nr:hypothetical protein [Candidatus Aegiribacteria sp.]
MRPIFTIHAGEYLLASRIEQISKDLNIWIPAKDKGIDLLITDRKNEKSVSIQVKMSRDYRPPKALNEFQKILAGTGWVRINRNALASSEADLWSIVIVSPNRTDLPLYLHIPPQVLLRNLQRIHGNKTEYHFYPWVTNNNTCIHGRGMGKKQIREYLQGNYNLGPRDLSEYYENWGFLDDLM